MQNTLTMTIGAEKSVFQIDGTPQPVTLPVGYDLISSRYFHHSPPTYDGLEYAINYIEDEIERAAKKIPYEGYELVSHTDFIRTIALLSGTVTGLDKSGETTARFLREDMERLFGQYAEIVAGRPAQIDEPDTSATFYAQLLIFREYMHHLKFEYVVVA